MATPTDPTAATPAPLDPAVTQSLVDYNLEAVKAEQNMSSLTNIFNQAGTALSGLSNKFKNAGLDLSNMGVLTGKSSAAFGALTTSIIGAQKSFESFAGVDTQRLTTFNDQVGQLIKTLTTPGTAVGAMSEAIDRTKNVLISMGRSATEVNSVIKQGPAFLAKYAENILVSADNALRLQNSFLQLTAQMGDTNTLFTQIDSNLAGIGDDLTNLNNITAKYMDVMANASQATGVQRDAVYQYASQINKLPGGIKELLGSMELGGKQTNLLTATIQHASGSGRQFSEIVQDMKQAMLEYGVAGSDALKFTANITEVANTFHAQVDDVRSALMNSAEAFKFFAVGEDNAKKMTQGMTESMNQYIGSLKSVGVPIQNALDMYKNYTRTVQGMSQAQEAFLSAQSGGPGGLRGGFQIDNLIKTGQFDELRKKVEQTIRKMTGPIVSFDDAQKSESAAAQYTRQLQILQQGPLGQMARTRAEAESLLESMRKGTTVQPGKSANESLKESIDRGSKIEQLSLTELQNINTNLMRMQNMGGVANLTTMQRALAARTGAGGGAEGTGAGINTAGQDRLRAAQARGMNPTEGSPMERTMKEAGSAIKSLPGDLSDSFSSLNESLRGRTFAQIEDFAPAGKQLGRSIPKSTTTGADGGGTASSTSSPGMNLHGNSPVPVVLASGSAINVNFTGACPHCGRDIHTTEVGSTVAPQALATGR